MPDFDSTARRDAADDLAREIIATLYQTMPPVRRERANRLLRIAALLAGDPAAARARVMVEQHGTLAGWWEASQDDD